jgi:hypothetical protein
MKRHYRAFVVAADTCGAAVNNTVPGTGMQETFLKAAFIQPM